MNFRKIVACAIYAAAIGGPIWAYLDTAPIRAAQAKLAANVSPLIAGDELRVKYDLDARAACGKLLPEGGTYVFSSDDKAQAWRNCILKAGVDTKSYAGAIAIAYSMQFWLDKHPGDVELHNVAVGVISAGWEDLNASERLKVFKLQDELSEAYGKSNLMRFFGSGTESGLRQFQRLGEMLDNAELVVVAPVLAQKQNDRRTEGLRKLAAI